MKAKKAKRIMRRDVHNWSTPGFWQSRDYTPLGAPRVEQARAAKVVDRARNPHGVDELRRSRCTDDQETKEATPESLGGQVRRHGQRLERGGHSGSIHFGDVLQGIKVTNGPPRKKRDANHRFSSPTLTTRCGPSRRPLRYRPNSQYRAP